MDKEKKSENRPPVVAVLGHVDHGKTSVLDYIRKTKVAEKESGGITQHIGAYEAESQGKKITFIDTPGHEAFSKMRSRGAKIADISILVIDASEGIKEQTKESIKAIKDSESLMIVALNKIDKPQCQSEWVLGELKKYGVETEQIGGKVPAIKISAKTGQGIDELLETILLLAEMEGLKAEISVPVEGVIIESSLDSKKGPIATLLVEKGILKEGDVLGTSSAFGKIKNISDFKGTKIKQALPSQPVQVLGFEKIPKVGEKFGFFADSAGAEKQIVSSVKNISRVRRQFVSESDEQAQEKRTMRVVLKADTAGSLEAIAGILNAFPQEKSVLEIVKSEVGNITSSDIKFAEGMDARIFGFKVKADDSVKRMADQKKIPLKIFEVIYELVEEARKSLERKIVPEIERIDLGKIKIIALFKKGKNEQIIGGRVLEGEAVKETLVEVFRNEELVGKGKIKNVEHEKKNVSSVAKGKEAGMLFLGEIQIEEGDILAVYREVKTKKEID